jgi:hypothetical protein
MADGLQVQLMQIKYCSLPTRFTDFKLINPTEFVSAHKNILNKYFKIIKSHGNYGTEMITVKGQNLINF